MLGTARPAPGRALPPQPRHCPRQGGLLRPPGRWRAAVGAGEAAAMAGAGARRRDQGGRHWRLARPPNVRPPLGQVCQRWPAKTGSRRRGSSGRKGAAYAGSCVRYQCTAEPYFAGSLSPSMPIGCAFFPCLGGFLEHWQSLADLATFLPSTSLSLSLSKEARISSEFTQSTAMIGRNSTITSSSCDKVQVKSHLDH